MIIVCLEETKKAQGFSHFAELERPTLNFEPIKAAGLKKARILEKDKIQKSKIDFLYMQADEQRVAKSFNRALTQWAHSSVEEDRTMEVHNLPRKRFPDNRYRISVASPGELQVGVRADKSYI